MEKENHKYFIESYMVDLLHRDAVMAKDLPTVDLYKSLKAWARTKGYQFPISKQQYHEFYNHEFQKNTAI
jgi:hypothetical protein